MRTNKERQQLIYRRTQELRCKERRKKQCMFSVGGAALCLMLVIGIGSFMPGVVKQAAVGNIDYTMGTASMLGHYEAIGICLYGRVSICAWRMCDGIVVSFAKG